MAKRLTLAYGPPGVGKTDALIAIIKHVYSETGKRSRVVCGDGSLANYLDSGLIEAGILDVCDYSAMEWPGSTTNRLAEGWWPTTQDDDGVWRGSELKETPKAELEKLGVYGFEALSTMIRDYLMGNIKGGYAWRSGKGEKIGQDSPYRMMDSELIGIDSKTGQGLYKQGTGTGEQFGGNPISHFNVAQIHGLGVVARSASLPCWVWWNTHEKLGEEVKKEGTGANASQTITGDRAIGPEVAGGALALSIPRKFNDTLHFTIARKVDSATDATTTKATRAVKDEYRIYFRDHYDPDGVVTAVPYKAIIRCAKAEMLPACGYVTGPQGKAILALYEIVAKAKRAATAEAEAMKAKVEGGVAA